MSRKMLAGIFVISLIVIMLWSALKEPGISDLSVTFEEVHLSRNENNTGPVIRRYLVTVSDTIWSDLRRYGDLMPHAKLGITEVYFFPKGVSLPSQLELTGSPFDTKYRSNLKAFYKKNAMGQVAFSTY